MLIIILIIVIVALLGVNCLVYGKFRQQKNAATIYEEMYEGASSASIQYRDMYLDAMKRDQVQAYNALEQGMTEITENYENDRLDLVAKIERLESEVSDVQHQAAITLNELGDRIEFQHRSMALYLETIMDYEASLNVEGGLIDYVTVSPKDCIGRPCKNHGEEVMVADGMRFCNNCGNLLEPTADQD